eukprot:TRINITY_DN48489_c0_g1_i1.p1 TRINITY_DN48489_c0_g1~~TRINITY_DN48489_c0_g1_i1.p1  ORF type:complete len:376 (-),score=33.95 TRINITY_DN48489_c0_g1_i1:98-1177(-)
MVSLRLSTARVQTIVGSAASSCALPPLRARFGCNFLSLRNAQPHYVRHASRITGLADEFRGAAPSSADSAQQRGRGDPRRVVAADKGFLSAAKHDNQIVLIHDYRDLKFLRRLSGAGIFASAMSCCAVGGAVLGGYGLEICGSLTFLAAGSALTLLMYFRTYVARAVLDPRRGRLSLTGCGLFGKPLAVEQHLPLTLIEPGYTMTQEFIKFRLRGSGMDPSTWIWFRMPRAQADGSARKSGVQVGSSLDSPALGLKKAVDSEVGASDGKRGFLGAGLGVSAGSAKVGQVTLGQDPFAMPASPSNEVNTQRSDREVGQRGQRSLTSLRLHYGCPADAVEEAKILDFLNDPTEYAAMKIRS